MKNWLWIPFVLLAGLLIGSWAPRMEMARQRESLAAAKREMQAADSRVSNLQGVLQMLRIDLREARKDAWESGARRTPDRADTNATSRTTDEPGSPARTNRRPRLSGKPLREQIETAAEAWRIRSAMARESFVERAGLDPDQAAAFDVLIEAMNMRLEHTINQWVTRFEETDTEPSAEEALRMMNELTGVMVLTYDEMDRKLPADWREESDGVELFNFIDPSAAMPLVRVEDRIRRGPEERPRE